MYFTIRKNMHRSRWFPKFTCKRVLIGSFTLIGDFSYDIGKKQTDSNKLIGLSDGWGHHKDSIRIGWRWNKIVKRVDIVGICYRGGKREIRTITRVDTNKKIPFTISIENNQYLIKVGNEFVTFERSSKWSFIRYFLFSYFGGTKKSPKDFKFKIDLY